MHAGKFEFDPVLDPVLLPLLFELLPDCVAASGDVGPLVGLPPVDEPTVQAEAKRTATRRAFMAIAEVQPGCQRGVTGR